jgi:hypothetical protein
MSPDFMSGHSVPPSLPSVPWWISLALQLYTGDTILIYCDVRIGIAQASYSQPDCGFFFMEKIACLKRVAAYFEKHASLIFLHHS